MKTTLIGHACLLIQSKGTTLLSDPCLFDIHFEELNRYFPKVEIHRDNFPEIDALYISHRHQDHFDIRTLAYLPKDLKVLCPQDDIIIECLKELGYQDINVVENFEAIQVKNLQLIPTPSLTQDYYPEHGLIIRDGEVNVWNQVDTIVSPQIIEYIQRICGQSLDFAHVRFQPLLEQNFTYNKASVLPFEEYSSFLKVARALQPKFAVPGSAGEHYVPPFEFLNHFVFPTTQEQFLTDLKEFAPEIESSTFQPGDVAEITPDGVNIHRSQTDLVKVTDSNDAVTAFNPLFEVPRIRTLTEDGEQQRQEMEAVSQFLEKELATRLSTLDSMDVWSHWKIGYRLEVFGTFDSEVWGIDFSASPKVEKGYIGRVNVYEGISCSELFKFIKGETNWDFVGASGQYRTFHNIYRVVGGGFEFYPQEKKFPQPLTEVFPGNKEMDREKYMKDVRRWKDKF